jgi:hypothetical protein
LLELKIARLIPFGHGTNAFYLFKKEKQNMSYSVLIPNKFAAKDIDAYVRPAVSGSAIENGMIFNLLTKSATAGESEVWTATYPVTGSLIGVWMALEPEIASVFSGTKQYRGFGTIQDFYTPAGRVFTAIKPVAGDIYTITADGLTGAATTGDYLVAADSDYQLTWSAGGGASTTATFKRIATTYISIPDGSISSGHTVAYQMVCLYN